MIFRRNPDFEKEMRALPEYKAALKRKAEPARRHADQFANRVMPRRGSRQIEVREDGDRVVLVNTNHGAQIEEFGTSKSPAYSPLRRAILAAGFRLKAPSD